MCPNPSDILLGALAILFPPLAVWVKRGFCSADSLINLALSLLGFLPGLIHAWYIIAVTPEYYDYEYERVGDVEAPAPPGPEPRGGAGQGQGRQGSVSYYYVDARQSGHGQGQGRRPSDRSVRGYGSMAGGGQQGKMGSSGQGGEVPPTYNEAIKGDNKVQRS